MAVAEKTEVQHGRRKKRAMLTAAAADLDAALQESRRAGLLEGECSEHVSFRAPKALVEAAKKRTGVTSPTDLGLIALAVLAQPDPVSEFMKKNRGVLGQGHRLDY